MAEREMLNGNGKSTLQKLISLDWRNLAAGAFDYNVRSHFQVLPPKVLQIITNYRCNARCAMCNIWQLPHKHELTVDEFRASMDPDPIFDRVEQLTVAGGESSLRADLVELVAYFVERMPRLWTLSNVTNGFLPKRILEQIEAVLKIITPRGIKLSMSVSIDGLGAQHDQVRGIPGAFDRAVETLTGLQELRKRYDFWLGVGYVVMHQNLGHAREFRTWARARGLDVGFQLVGFHDSYVSNLDRQDEVNFQPEDRAELIAFMSELAGERLWRNVAAFYWGDMVRMYRDAAPRATPCPFTLEGLAIDVYGDVFYCLSTPRIGNFLEEKRPIGEIYYDPKNLRYRAEEMRRRICPRCNSACGTEIALKKDAKRYLKFLATGKV
jgi:MoaA/NifB/PqqE/SkfB family radical SAM enzyme